MTPKEETPSAEALPLLSEDSFQNEESRKLFEAIDELRNCGANHDIDLPELIIVGDQSAGKSSLLQSLTDIPFPVSDRLCTRFPTRIVSRRTPFQAESIKVSIEPTLVSSFENFSQQANIFSSFDQTARLERLERYAKFARVVPDLAAEGFKDILNEALELMEIPSPSSSQGHSGVSGTTKEKHNFSNDVLKVEISGPNRSYFSILDLPGIFQSLTKDLTEVEKFGVRNLSANHMTSKQSVIICVASGTNDVANQAILDLASEKDPTGDRTVGVITKCDIAQHPDQLIDVARNTEKYFRHGWFVVRNRTPAELEEAIKPVDRHIRETKFFNMSPWNSLPSERRGTQALKKYLAELLSNRTRESFPTMLSTLRDRIKSITLRLEDLGCARGTLEEKRAFLTRIAQQFNSLASQAVHGRYETHSANNLKLRRLVREANDSFSSAMKISGHAVPFYEQSLNGTNETTGSTSSTSPVFSTLATKNPHNINLDFSQPTTSLVRASLPFSKTEAFEDFSMHDSGEYNVYQNIYMTGWSKAASFEELRLSDYIHEQSPAKSTSSFAKSPEPVFSMSNKPVVLFQSKPLASGGSASPTNFLGPFFPNTSSTFTEGLSQGRQQSEIYKWIALEVQTNRGTELQGTFNPDILPALFHKQIIRWKKYSEGHFLRVTKITVESLVAMLGLVCPDSLVRGRLEKAIVQASDAAEKKGLRQLSDRFDTLMSSHLQTNHSAFAEKVRVARLQRFQAALDRYRSRQVMQPAATTTTTTTPTLGVTPKPASTYPIFLPFDDHKLTIDMRDTALLFDELHASNAQNLADEIHDILKAYYEIARDDFVEFVNHLVVEPYLNGLDGPVKLFSPSYVSVMSPDQLESLAIEPFSLLHERLDLKATLTRLRDAERIAVNYS